MKVYLDACCLSRLTDDQSQPGIRQEAEAIERVFVLVRNGMVELISSEVLEDEVGRNPSAERRLEGETLVSFASQKVLLNVRIVRRGRELSAAEFAKAAVLLSTDDRFIRRATRGDGYPNIPVQNPVLSIQEFSP